MIDIIGNRYNNLLRYIKLDPLPYSTAEIAKKSVLPGAKILSRQGQNIYLILYKID